MTRLNTRRLFSLALVTVMTTSILSIATISSASAFKSGSGSCAGEPTCTGFDLGGYGNHFTNGGGSGSLAGHNAVRFDGFRPRPGLAECIPSGNDRAQYSALGIPSNYQGVSYEHRRVGAQRSNPDNIIVGVEEDSAFWNQPVEINLDTLETRPTSNPSHAPQGPWVGANWLGRQYCLPLNGGAPFEAILSNAQPELKITSKGASATELDRVLIGSRSTKLSVVVHQDSLVELSNIGSVAIFFQMTGVKALVCDDKEESKEIRNQAEHPADLRHLAGCYAADDRRAPVLIKERNATFSTSPDGATVTADLDVKFKRSGKYYIAVQATYNADVQVDGTSVYSAVGLANNSGQVIVNAISARSINRSSLFRR